jgi:hypothetical protein
MPLDFSEPTDVTAGAQPDAAKDATPEEPIPGMEPAVTEPAAEPAKEPAPEAAKEPEKAAEPAKQSEPTTAELLALQRRERALLERDRAIKEREAKLAPLAKALESKDPTAALEALGLDTDAVLDAIINKDTKKAEDATPEGRIKRLEAALAERDRRDKEAAEAAERRRAAEEGQSIHNQAIGMIRVAAEADPKSYPLITRRGAGAHEIVLGTYQAYAAEHGEPPTLAQAMQWTEQYLRKEAEADAQALGLTKAQAAAVASAAQAPDPDDADVTAAGFHLSHKTVPIGLRSRDSDGLPMDPRERTRAIAAELLKRA